MSLLRDRFAGRIPPALFVLAVAVVVLALPASVVAGGGGTNQPQTTIKTASDAAMDKLHSTLEHKVEEGSTADVKVYVTAQGGAAKARALLDEARVAGHGGVALAVGEIRPRRCPSSPRSRASSPSARSSSSRPGSRSAPGSRARDVPQRAAVNAASRASTSARSPSRRRRRSRARTSRKLKKLALLDAKTHNFAEAWKAGFTGAGVTVGVLDGGTDFGHPDLSGRGRPPDDRRPPAGTAGRRRSTPSARCSGSPRRSQIDQGLSWYT